MRTHPSMWLLRALWLALPFTAGDAIGAATDGRLASVRAAAAVLAWLAWAIGMIAAAVPHPLALTALRLLAPAAPIATAVATIVAERVPATAVVGLVVSALAAVVALTGWVADCHVDAASYGHERRFALRIPGTFLFGPIPVFWTLCVVMPTVAILAAAARVWWLAAGAALLAAVAMRPGLRAFHGLSQRWLVFVPAGVTVVDHVGLVDPVFLSKQSIVRLGPAFADGDHLDLTSSAMGLAIEVRVGSTVELTKRSGRDEGDLIAVSAVAVAPARPAEVLAEAKRRGVT